MNSDAKIILLYVQQQPAAELRGKLDGLSEWAKKVGVKPRPYQKAKKFLKSEGYLHEWRYQKPDGLWATAQILANAPCARPQVEAFWETKRHLVEQEGEFAPDAEFEGFEGRSVAGSGAVSPQVVPTDPFPTVGLPSSRIVGGYPPDGQLQASSSSLPTRSVRRSKTERRGFASQFDAEGEAFWTEPPEWLTEEYVGAPELVRAAEPVAVRAVEPVPAPMPPLPPEPAPVPVPAPVPETIPAAAPAAVAAEPDAEELAARDPEVIEGERVLLSLRHAKRELYLGVREARLLAGMAAEWLRRGVSAADVRRQLSSDLPEEGVRSAMGFLKYRLMQKMPEEPAPKAAVGAMSSGVSRPQGVDGSSDGGPDGSEEYVPVPYTPPPLVTCEGEGDEHVFRAYGGETKCGECRQTEAYAIWAADQDARARARGEDGFTGDGKGGWRDRCAAALGRHDEPATAPPTS